MGALELRTATDEDLPAVAALVVRAYRGPGSEHGWTSEADYIAGPRTDVATVRGLAAVPGSVFVVAVLDDEVVGTALLQRRGGTAYFGMFAVDPQRQRLGTGAAVLAACETLARDEWGCARLEMTVIDRRTDLIAWYERRGYAPTGEVDDFPWHAGITPVRTDFRLLHLARRL
ncbi:MAG: GNAT family N-acetyltransferase [Frankiales bacterium]|nr:GNAT family N-acetyltransferase [Frankiales bacterium]